MGHTPFFLMFGHRGRFSMDLFLNIPEHITPTLRTNVYKSSVKDEGVFNSWFLRTIEMWQRKSLSTFCRCGLRTRC